MRYLLFTPLLFFSIYAKGQVQDPKQKSLEELKQEVIDLRTEVQEVHLNLGKTSKRLRTGVAVATIGYTVTIAGGLMLGRENDSLGQALLVVGGATGITGTFILVDSFKFMGRGRKKK